MSPLCSQGKGSTVMPRSASGVSWVIRSSLYVTMWTSWDSFLQFWVWGLAFSNGFDIKATLRPLRCRTLYSHPIHFGDTVFVPPIQEVAPLSSPCGDWMAWHGHWDLLIQWVSGSRGTELKEGVVAQMRQRLRGAVKTVGTAGFTRDRWRQKLRVDYSYWMILIVKPDSLQ